MRFSRGPGLRRSSKALIPITGVVALIVPANFMECIYSVGGSTYQLSEAAITCNTKPHDESPFRFCAWLLCCGFSETAYEVESCSLGLYQSFLSHASGLPHNHFFATSDKLDATQTEDRPPSPDTWVQNIASTEEEFAELKGYRVALGCAQFFCIAP